MVMMMETCFLISNSRKLLTLVELMVVDDALRSLIHSRAAESELFRAARTQGFVPMRDDGQRLVAEGITSLEEVLRVTRD